MKKLLCLLFLFVGTISFGQTPKSAHYLVQYGQVWGFLKYFHPAPGEMDWDQVLLDDYKVVSECEDDEVFNGVLTKLIERCGEYTAVDRSHENWGKMEVAFEWMIGSDLPEEVLNYLTKLRWNKPEFDNHYIQYAGQVGNPEIINERKFDEDNFTPDVLYLALTRYWNVINYFAPNRHLISEHWGLTYYSKITDFTNAEDWDDYYFAVRRLSATIEDGHGFVRTKNSPFSKYNVPPFWGFQMEDGTFISYAKEDSLHPNPIQRLDRIVKYNGTPIEECWKYIAKTNPSSNAYYSSKGSYFLFTTEADSITVTVERDGQLIHAKLKTISMNELFPKEDAKKYEVPSWEIRKDSISGISYGYVHLGELTRKEINWKFKRKMKKVDHMVIDVRNYPNWTVIKLSKFLLKGERHFAKFDQPRYDLPGTMTETKSQIIGGKKGYDGNVIILCDYHTMSQAEYTVMALQQHPKSYTIGGQTAGADGNISGIPLPFGIEAVFSGLGVLYPNGDQTQQVGVKRDLKIVQDSSWFKGNDRIMNAALEYIRQQDSK